jgi:signal transduction histidine kinase
VVVAIQNPPDQLPGPLLAAVAWPALAVAAGDLLRTRRETIVAAEERARRAEESREEEARRRVAEERLHIARELHDVVAHRMAVVNVQAGVAEHLLRARPDDAAAALRIVRSSAQAALDNLGSILNLLRSAGASDDSVEPAPTLTELTALIDSYRDAGLAVEYETSGAPRPLADTTQLALYRTVQEALTNAHKHGDGHVRLRISHAADGVAVELINPVAVPSVGDDVTPRSGAAGDAGGFGLTGMRERVLAAGGSLHVGLEGESSFAVRAHFPIAEEQR